MKKIVYSILATVAGLVLLFSYRTSLDQPTASPIVAGTRTAPTAGGATPSASASAAPSATASSGESSDDGGSTSSGSSSNGSSGSSGGSGSQASSGLKDGTYTGGSAGTPYGPVQVKITVSNGVISRVDVPRYPNGSGRDQEINSYALPQLVDETVTAQSAQIDMVSGATYTSQGYLESLQSAIDKARA
jgi:uncharacterized protein with FMN-binding domain